MWMLSYSYLTKYLYRWYQKMSSGKASKKIRQNERFLSYFQFPFYVSLANDRACTWVGTVLQKSKSEYYFLKRPLPFVWLETVNPITLFQETMFTWLLKPDLLFDKLFCLYWNFCVQVTTPTDFQLFCVTYQGCGMRPVPRSE